MKPDHVTAHGLQQRLMEAMQQHVQGRLEEAQAGYESLLKALPRHPDVLYSLGTLYLQREQWEKAAACLRQVMAVLPGNAKCLLPLAKALAGMKAYEDATQQLLTLLILQPNHGEAADFLYEVCSRMGQDVPFELHPIHRIISRHYDLAVLRYVAARLCQSLDLHDQRLQQLEAVWKTGIRNESIHIALVLALRDSGAFERAMALCRDGLIAHPDSLMLLKLRAELYLSFGQYDKAQEDAAHAVRRAPEDLHARTLLGGIQLLVSDGREGLEYYSAQDHDAMGTERWNLEIPHWKGEDLPGKKLLLWSNQSMGNHIMYASLLPWLVGRGVRVTLATHRKLMPLFARSFPEVRVVEYVPEHLAQQGCDMHAPLTELVRYVLPHYTPAQHGPYLKADEVRVDKLRRRYEARAMGKKRVGISWRTMNATRFAQCNIVLEQWTPIFTLPHVQCVSLQYGNTMAEIEALEKRQPRALLEDFIVDAYEDVDGLAAQICAMDEVVSIQNVTAHLAGALGRKTTLMLCSASDWRWGLQRADSQWYRSVHIERQETLLDWKPVLMRVSSRL